MNKRICILTSVHPALDVRIFQKQAKTLAQTGYDVNIIAQHNKNEIVDGVKIIGLPKPRNRFDRMIRKNFGILKLALKQKADIYHFHDPELIPIGIVLKLLSKKVIYDVHEDLPEQILSKYYIPPWQRKSLAVFFKLIEQLASKTFNYIITATDNIQEKFNTSEKTVAIRNFPLFDSKKSIDAHDKDSSNNVKMIYAGGLTEIRGITQTVQALEYMNNNVELILLGEFWPKEYGAEVKKMKGFEKVRYLGKVPFEEVPDYYSSADIGIVCFLPERNHLKAMPNKIFEYMAAGIPVIASNFPLWREIVEVNECGICVDPLNPKEITKAIQFIIEHPAEAEQMGKNGFRAVEEKYNWRIEEEKLIRVYEKLMNATGA